MAKRSTRALALALAALTVAGCAAPAAAAPIDSGVTPTYDEAYYATLDYYGNLLEGSVVKSYALNGADQITDYGAYDEVVNLTDATPAALEQGSAAFQFGRAPSHFYFEGKTKQPFQNLPWTVTLRYTLNGVPVQAEELAGQKGVVEILLDLVPNEGAGSYARYNYTLQAMALFNEDDILSLEAEGAQVQLVGNLRTVLFLALPGEERHFTIRVGSDDFSFGGMTILMVPATLAQLEEIAKLSQRKDELEEDYHNLSGSLDALLDAMNDIQEGLYASAGGLDQLDAARGTISSGKGQLYDDAGVLRGDLTGIADLLEPVEQRTLALSQTITSSKSVLGDMTDTAVSLRVQLENLEKALTGLEDGSSDVRQVIRGLADMKSSLRSLQRALGDSYVGGGSSGDRNTPKLQEKVDKTKQAGSAYEEKNQTDFFEKMLTLSGDRNARDTASKMSGALDLYDKTLSQTQAAKLEEARQAAEAAGGSLTQEQEEAIKQQVKDGVDQQFAAQEGWSETQKLKQLHEAKDNLSFQEFCGTLPGVDDKTAKQMDDLWTVYNSGKPSGTAEQADRPAEEAPASAEEPTGLAGPEMEPAVPQEKVPASGTLAESAALTAFLHPSVGPVSAALAGSGLYIDDITAGDLPGEPIESSAPDEPAPSSDESGGQTVGGAAVDLIVGGLDDAMSQASAKIDAIQSELNSTINRITRPTGRVVGELADLCDEVDDLVDLIDSAEDMSAALRQSSEKIRSILDGVDALRVLLDEYEPTLQEGIANVGSLSTSAVSALRDLETLLADSEALMKSSGSQLDSGTRQALRGLSATLRQTARAMAATGDVRDAKATINTILEDTWREYTGDVNNILMMDAGAQAVSLTDSRNPAPSSVQVLIRTQEIKAEEPAAEQLAAAAPQSTTFWGRVAQMFRDFWSAVTHIFH